MMPTIAAFDFDHTLSDRDSLLPYLILLKGWKYTGLQLTQLTYPFLNFLAGSLSRQGVKEEILKRFIDGQSIFELEKMGVHYSTYQLDRYIKPKALQKFKWHQSQGHRCLIISASLELYLKPWGQKEGFETVLGSRLETSHNGIVSGKLAGLNCWGGEKVRRLLEYAGPKENYHLYAYGDSKGDEALLSVADYPFYKKF